MSDILHRVGIDSKPEKAFAALTTVDGLRGWWVTSTKGDASKDGVIDFGFCDMKVVEAEPGKHVRWKCVRGPADWLGTEVVFDLNWEREQTFVLFKHAGWKEPTPFMHHCSTKWATFLLSLVEYVEQGAGRPAPHDRKIHVGD